MSETNTFEIIKYTGEEQLPDIIRLMSEDLSEPYNVFTYRYFLADWPHLAFLAQETQTQKAVGAIVCKLEPHKSGTNRGYIAMLAVHSPNRKHGVGSALVKAAIDEMVVRGADEITLETEITNATALSFYERLGFVRERRLARYYMNNGDAFQLCLSLRNPNLLQEQEDQEQQQN